MDNIFTYISKKEYNKICKSLINGQTINIYKDKNVEIDLKRIGSKIYKFISHYGQDNIDECLEDMYLKSCKVAI